MNRIRPIAALTLALLVVSSYPLRADVRTDEKGRVEFAGLFGKMVNFFGGKAAKEGVTSTRALKGERMATLTDVGGQIIDLNEEKIYTLDAKKKTYTVITFAELRRQMEEAKKKAEEEMRKEQAREKKEAPPARDPNEKELEVDFSVKKTGERRTINGFDTQETVMTITLREKGRKLEESGGLVLTSDMWMAPKIAAMKEIADFYVRYAQKLGGPMVAGASAEDMAAAMAMYPSMKQALARMNAENVKLDGTSIMSTVKIDAVKSADQVAQDAKSTDTDSKAAPKSIGGLVGGLTRRAAQKKASEGQNEPKDRSTIMTITSEMLKVSTDVGAADVAIPAGYKEGK
jgi:sRNA-binding protein